MREILSRACAGRPGRVPNCPLPRLRGRAGEGASPPERPTADARRPLWPLLLALPLLAVGLWQLGGGLYIEAKARFGQVLLERAWDRTLAGEDHARPWPWADTWPVARLEAPAHGADLIVLAGAGGASLAWGPGHQHGTARPGGPGLSVIGGHRDTHLRFLEHVAIGDAVRVETPDGRRIDYRVTATAVVDHREAALHRTPGRPALLLVTCWPFDAVVPGGPLRYVVQAEPAAAVAAAGRETGG